MKRPFGVQASVYGWKGRFVASARSSMDAEAVLLPSDAAAAACPSGIGRDWPELALSSADCPVCSKHASPGVEHEPWHHGKVALVCKKLLVKHVLGQELADIGKRQ